MVQMWQCRIGCHSSSSSTLHDDEESDGEEDLYSGVATRRPDMALHQPLDWEGLCAYKRMLLTGAVAVGSRADVVDQRTMAGGHMSAGSGMIRLFN